MRVTDQPVPMMYGALALRIGFGLLLIAFLMWLRRQAARQRAVSIGDALVFQASWGLRLLALAFFGSFVYFALHAGRDLWTTLGAASLALALLVMLFAWPAKIVVDSSGIRQAFWWRSDKRIDWDQVLALSRSMRNCFNVYSAEGTVIRFSPLHVDRSRFELEVIQRARIERFV